MNFFRFRFGRAVHGQKSGAQFRFFDVGIFEFGLSAHEARHMRHDVANYTFPFM